MSEKKNEKKDEEEETCQIHLSKTRLLLGGNYGVCFLLFAVISCFSKWLPVAMELPPTPFFFFPIFLFSLPFLESSEDETCRKFIGP